MTPISPARAQGAQSAHPHGVHLSQPTHWQVNSVHGRLSALGLRQAPESTGIIPTQTDLVAQWVAAFSIKRAPAGTSAASVQPQPTVGGGRWARLMRLSSAALCWSMSNRTVSSPAETLAGLGLRHWPWPLLNLRAQLSHSMLSLSLNPSFFTCNGWGGGAGN